MYYIKVCPTCGHQTKVRYCLTCGKEFKAYKNKMYCCRLHKSRGVRKRQTAREMEIKYGGWR